MSCLNTLREQSRQALRLIFFQAGSLGGRQEESRNALPEASPDVLQVAFRDVLPEASPDALQVGFQDVLRVGFRGVLPEESRGVSVPTRGECLLLLATPISLPCVSILALPFLLVLRSYFRFLFYTEPDAPC